MRVFSRPLFFSVFLFLSGVQIFGTACPALSAGLRYLHDGWLLSIEESTALIMEQGAQGGHFEPWSVTHGGWLTFGQTKLFSMDDLPLVSVSAGVVGKVSGVHWRAEISWERTGLDLFLEDRRDLYFGVGDKTSVGLDISRWVLWIDGQREFGHLEYAAVVRHRRSLGGGNILSVGWRLDPVAPPVWFGDQGRRWFADVSLIGERSRLGFGLVLDKSATGTPGLSLEFSAGLCSGFGLGIRADPPTGAIGPNTMWHRGKLLIRTSHFAHPELGLTHRFSLSVGSLMAAGQ